MANELSSGLELRESEIQSHCCIHILAKTFQKGMNHFIPPAIG